MATLNQPATYPNKPVWVVNPEGKASGPYTGRCTHCESDDLWVDCTTYGCNNCGAMFPNS